MIDYRSLTDDELAARRKAVAHRPHADPERLALQTEAIRRAKPWLGTVIR